MQDIIYRNILEKDDVNAFDELAKYWLIREIDSIDRRNRSIKKNKKARSDLVIFKIIEKLNKQILKEITDNELDEIHQLFSSMNNSLSQLLL